jgi:adenylylsulfate kinase
MKNIAKVFWLTGLSGSGKTTLALEVVDILRSEGVKIKLLDGDVLREGLNKDLGFSLEDRKENIRRVAELSRILIDCGIHCINCFISPTRQIRELARSIIGKEHFREIFVKASLDCCEKRDVKGLYKKARKGLINDFTGIHSPFENPTSADLIIDTEKENLLESIDKLYTFIYENSR